MKSLGVLPPETYLRVSDYVEEIVDFIQKLIERGFAYTDSQGNVWFDVSAFHKPPEQVYGKFHPDQFDLSEQTEEESALGKKTPTDFALWKACKPGEPQWSSPWGSGRPGWHIECSAMSTAHFDSSEIDLHSGGIDLKFPHHNNEIAQCEAHFGCSEWVRIWIHTGHIHIAGRKMAKSLKNFITIKVCLLQFFGAKLIHHNSGNVENSECRSVQNFLSAEPFQFKYQLQRRVSTRCECCP
jgi:cysteinyl-tRNA synthetase